MVTQPIKSDEQMNLIPLSAVPLPATLDAVNEASCARVLMRPLVALTHAIAESEDAINQFFEKDESVYFIWEEVLRPACLRVYQKEYGDTAEPLLSKDEAVFSLKRFASIVTPESPNSLRTALYATVINH